MRTPIFISFISLIILTSAFVVRTNAAGKSCESTLSKLADYTSAFDELASGQISLEKMQIDGATEASQIALKNVLDKKTEELTKVFGEDVFKKTLDEKIKSMGQVLQAKQKQKKAKRKKRINNEWLLSAHLWEEAYFSEDKMRAYQIGPLSKLIAINKELLDFESLQIHDLKTKKILHNLTIPGSHVIKMSFSKDERLFAAGYRDATRKKFSIKVWDVKTGLEKVTLDLDVDEFAESISFTPDNKFILVQMKNDQVYGWNLNEPTNLINYALKSKEIALSPTGDYFISAKSQGDGNLLIKKVALDGDEETQSLASGVFEYKISPNGQFVLTEETSTGLRMQVVVRDVHTGKIRFEYLLDRENLEKVMWLPDSKGLILITNVNYADVFISKYKIGEPQTPKPYSRKKIDVPASSNKWFSEDLNLIISQEDGRRIYSTATGEPIAFFEPYIEEFVVSSDSRHIIIESNKGHRFSIWSAPEIEDEE